MKAWAVRHLRELGVSIKMNEQRMPLQLEEQDFTDAALILGVHERNHRPLLLDQFPALAEQSNVRFWNVPDVEELSPIEALPMLESMTRTLIDELESGLK
jgi:protein-tyrosine-phosphatase